MNKDELCELLEENIKYIESMYEERMKELEDRCDKMLGLIEMLVEQK